MNQVREWTGSCQRCLKEASTHIMSMFDVSLICMECYDAERHHPGYEEARTAELRALKDGDRNFKGVGYPMTNIANDPIDW